MNNIFFIFNINAFYLLSIIEHKKKKLYFQIFDSNIFA